MPRRSENVHDAMVDARDQLMRYRVIMGQGDDDAGGSAAR
jgi:hypothetical protein